MLEANTTDPPVQKDVAGVVMLAIGNAFTVIVVAAEVALQPAVFVTSTIYDPAAVAVYVAAVPT